jgi:hypothetical protein
MTRRVIGKGILTAGLGALLLVGAGAWEDAEADRRGHRGGRHHHHHHGSHGKHFHGSFFFGPRVYVGPRVYPYYYGYPRYYYGGYYVAPPPPVVVTPPPTSYVERPRPPASQFWHYCQDPAGYYPDVPQCPGGWIQVSPRSE